jgi:hypothetical protein
MTCSFRYREVYYKYEDVPSPIVQKLVQVLTAKHPEVSHMPMLQGRVFHPHHDIYCKKDCLSEDEIEEYQVLTQEPHFYGNMCQEIQGRHPLDTQSSLMGLHFEFGQSTDEEAEKLKRKRIGEHRTKEAVKRKVEEHLEEMHNNDSHEYNEGYHTDNADLEKYEQAVAKAREAYRKEMEQMPETAGTEEFGGDL